MKINLKLTLTKLWWLWRHFGHLVYFILAVAVLDLICIRWYATSLYPSWITTASLVLTLVASAVFIATAVSKLSEWAKLLAFFGRPEDDL